MQNRNSTAQNQHVSQPIAKPNVVGRLLGQREIKFKYIFKTYDGRFIVEIFTLKELEYGGLQNFLSRLHDIIIVSKCQYTGLKDKNGKEIYESDILKGTHSVPLYVVLQDGKFCFYNDYSSGSDALSQMRVEKLDVIGNIFENPELLQALR